MAANPTPSMTFRENMEIGDETCRELCQRLPVELRMPRPKHTILQNRIPHLLKGLALPNIPVSPPERRILAG
jgi:hypothetical protein